MTTIYEAYKLPEQARHKMTENHGALGKDDFLKILIAQLQNQDPLNPMEDREFVAQMAQFSTLEQMMSMNKAIQSMVHAQMSGSLVQHSELIGKKVTWMRIVDIDEYRRDIEYVENVVTAVKLELDGQLRIQLDDGRWISHDQLYQVSENKVEDVEQIDEETSIEDETEIDEETTDDVEENLSEEE